MSFSRWLPRSPRETPGLRLFAFPWAGGGATVFQTWASGLPADVELLPVQLPGREERLGEPAFERIEPLVEATRQALAPHLDVPFAFYGHSMGALVAFELTRALRRRGGPMPARLMVSGRRAPHLPVPRPHLHALPDAEFLAGLRRLQGTDDAVLESSELMALVLPTLRADFAVCETRVHAEEPPLDLPITAFGGVSDREAGFADVAAWRHHTRGGFRSRMFPGHHFFPRSCRVALLAEIAIEVAAWRFTQAPLAARA